MSKNPLKIIQERMCSGLVTGLGYIALCWGVVNQPSEIRLILLGCRAGVKHFFTRFK